jgi:hypothetical protein
MKGKEAGSAILKDLSKKHNLKLYAIYTYNLSNIRKSKAVRFVYCLKGRGSEQGIVERMNGKFLAPGCFLVPIKKDKEMQEVFKLWSIKFKRRLMLTD